MYLSVMRQTLHISGLAQRFMVLFGSFCRAMHHLAGIVHNI